MIHFKQKSKHIFVNLFTPSILFESPPILSVMHFATLPVALAVLPAVFQSTATAKLDQIVLSAQGLPDGQVLDVDSSWFSNDDDIDNTDILTEGSLSIIVPVPIDTDPPPDFDGLSSDIVQQSLPYLLQEFGIDSSEIQALVDEAIPLIHQGVIDAVSGSDGDVSAKSQEVIVLDIFSWIAKVISKAANIVQSGAANIGCGVWSAAATPVFTGGAYLFEAVNSNHPGVPTSDDQDFYIFPVHGSLSHDDNISIHYNATFPWPIPVGRVAITWGKDIYVNSYGANVADRTDVKFEYITRKMLHELTHVQQFKSLGYITPAFGAKYLFQHCMVGFKYLAIPMEIAAKANEAVMDHILRDPIGREFQRLYNDQGLQASLGLPNAKSFTGPDASWNYQLLLQNGLMTIQCPSGLPPCS